MIVKICGITSVEDAGFALAAGADWIGLNLVAGPRRIDLAHAKRILCGMDDASRAVALVHVDQRDRLRAHSFALRQHGLRRLQLYGDVSADVVANLHTDGFELLYVQSVCDDGSLAALQRFLDGCDEDRPDHVLFDAGADDRLGGTGRRANWDVLRAAREAGRFHGWPPVMLAGGLNADIVAEAIHTLRPEGVDVSSGVESAPGKKDRTRMAAFVDAVRAEADGP